MSDLLLDLDLGGGASGGRRAALETALRDALRTGRLDTGTRLPSSRALAGELGLARSTVVSVFEQLVAEGLLRATHGSGTVVADVPRLPGGLPGATPARVPPTAALRVDFVPGEPDCGSFPRSQWMAAVR